MLFLLSALSSSLSHLPHLPTKPCHTCPMAAACLLHTPVCVNHHLSYYSFNALFPASPAKPLPSTSRFPFSNMPCCLPTTKLTLLYTPCACAALRIAAARVALRYARARCVNSVSTPARDARAGGTGDINMCLSTRGAAAWRLCHMGRRALYSPTPLLRSLSLPGNATASSLPLPR